MFEFEEHNNLILGCESDEFNNSCKLLAAAVINQRFREQLLSDPKQAVEKGYEGQSFLIGAAYKEKIGGIKAISLAEFAIQLTNQFVEVKTINPCFAGD